MIILTLCCVLLVIVYMVITMALTLTAAIFSLITAPFIAISEWIELHKKHRPPH